MHKLWVTHGSHGLGWLSKPPTKCAQQSVCFLLFSCGRYGMSFQIGIPACINSTVALMFSEREVSRDERQRGHDS
ncbi:hypothetical protein L227DRAFT_581245 [Lentinus tigrinus ALCF2SS1-6]|uniref:Uncharacterized protein n=1 Tax=Lentinus tigrinus ALCF2SS1-6 TaxID=1328759 RepID=A0A5C2RSW0_9APHY|nr:hypothetical protein L227DRAFT_581245 [Lentinus tigrinus ALCF2SS1-6]